MKQHLHFFCSIVFCALFLSFSVSWRAAPTAGQKVDKVLFVGNSLTYTNDLPALFARLGKSRGREIEVQSLTYPNYALEDHLADNKLQLLISNGKFDYVIVQQGPSSGTSGREMLIRDGQRIHKMCKKAGSRLAFYMVWPSKGNYRLFDSVIKSYTEAAEKADAILCPVGQVWKEYIDSKNDYSYYGPDDFHPSLQGSEVAAEVIYNSIYGN